MDSSPADRELRERPVAELLRDLSEQTTTLVRQELELAKAELAHKGKQAGVGGGLVGGAGVVGLLALGALTACIIAALSTAMATWLAALIVAVVYAAVAGALALVGKTRLNQATPAAPEQTIETMKEDVQWAKTRAKSGRT
jgi:predicted lipid-binding transport protein (Tim44 family)